MEIGEKIFAGMEEPQWLEQNVMGELKLWHIMFICLGVVTVMIVMVCCCVRFRIPRTKQQIEADYQRRKITAKFRHQLETIQDNKMDAMSLTDALELLHETTEKSKPMDNNGSQQSSVVSPQQSSLDAAFPEGPPQKPEPQVAGLSFVKFATKVSHLAKLGGNKTPEPPAPTKMDF
ncbi:transmembrane inner ear expressed protein [Cydia pomonella]|uniref:transmembrane inner ear expressed protein n=1 Tax=Cydia pomonella TaxID=82600 RepID=UPI002ADD5BBB|nr:transmembrane inner ear expressed protein [Cydia pomonella]